MSGYNGLWANIVGWKHGKNARKKSIKDLVVYGKRKTDGQCYVYIVFSFLKVVKVQAQYMYISTLNLFVLNEDKQV